MRLPADFNATISTVAREITGPLPDPPRDPCTDAGCIAGCILGATAVIALMMFSLQKRSDGSPGQVIGILIAGFIVSGLIWLCYRIIWIREDVMYGRRGTGLTDFRDVMTDEAFQTFEQRRLEDLNRKRPRKPKRAWLRT
ncbi:hypothetical protein GGR57DRAFT_64528 [Xylariaceae sp. FL1272]|nr:hypothetical protein GGR57DRAFT_64528 [Xylariaceae sp. FL1272]